MLFVFIFKHQFGLIYQLIKAAINCMCLEHAFFERFHNDVTKLATNLHNCRQFQKF